MAGSRVLLISYLLPPAGGVGVQRPLSFLRYLPEAGCPVMALTARNPVTGVYDPALLDRMPPGAPVHRAWTFELPHSLRDRIWKKASGGRREPTAPQGAKPPRAGWKSWLLNQAERLAIPDPQKAWRPLATRKALQLASAGLVDAVVVSAPPFSSLRIGVEIKRRFPAIKLISDFRDEWVGFYLAELDPPPSARRVEVSRREEREAVEASDHVVTVTPTMRDSIRGRYPEQPESKFLSILNGYDPAAFEAFRSRPLDNGRLNIVYTGTVYANRQYSPLRWLEPVEELEPEARGQIHTRLVGRIEPGVAERLARLSSSREELGFVPQAEALRHMEEADALLLIVGNPTSMAGKLFEYLATGKPVAALTPPGGEVARLLDETQGGFWADINDPEAVRRLARQLVEWKRSGMAFSPNRASIERFSRPALTREFAEKTGIVR
jgi:glycosyltransferase involved in cell wall biosynthesis